MEKSLKSSDGVVKLWGESDRPVHDLRKILSQYVREPDDMSEVRIEGERPIVVQRTEEDNMIVEVSAAYKSTAYPRAISQPGGGSSGAGIDEIKQVFDNIESPAATTEEIAEHLGCSPSEAERRLVELEHRGTVDHKQSGRATIWWLDDENSESNDIESPSAVPDFVREGIERSQRDIEEWLRDRQNGDESLEETHDRIRGSPDPDDVRNLVVDSDFDADAFRASIRNAASDDSDTNLSDMFE